MAARTFPAQLRRFIRHSRLLQVGLICAFWLAGETLARLSGLPLPGGLIGLAVVLGLLATRGLSIFSMKRGADWFLADMLLFFVPAVLAVLDHREFLGITGLKILFVILLSTAAVMVVTAFAVDVCLRWKVGYARTTPTPR